MWKLGALMILTAVVVPRTASATDQSFYPETFFSGDADVSREWAFNQFKGECHPGEALLGLSSTSVSTEGFTTSLLPRTVLCSNMGVSESYVYTGAEVESTHSLTQGSDDRADFATGNWDHFSGLPDTVMAECGFKEAVTGVAEASDGSHKITTILCAPIAVQVDANPSACNTRFFSLTSDNRRSTSGGDWDPGASKNQCGDTQILKGVSAVLSTGELHAILCCSSQPDPS